MESPVLKSALWTLVGIMIQVSFTQPASRVSEKEAVRDEGSLMKLIVHHGANIAHGLIWYMSFMEITCIHSPWFRRIIFPHPYHPATIDMTFMAPFTLLCLSFLLRMYTFYVMGDLFTFDLTIRLHHKLITHGPYRLVRHPSYTAAFGIILGNAILHLSGRRTWAIDWAFWGWMSMASVVCWKTWLRTSSEDEMLRNTFGKEWEAYRKRVPYRLIPGII